MPLQVPLPQGMRARLRANTHPGLLLDKYVESWDPDAPPGKLSERVQKPALQSVAALSQAEPSGLDLRALQARRDTMLVRLEAQTLRAITAAPLTLHLSRASALENAGICLHPLYGFVYLPGTGVKGMAHAYATEVWLPAQANKDAAWDTICHVFGWAPSPWLRTLAERLEVQVPDGASAGAVVFHDAWPVDWPRLIVDIVNNHHPTYYQRGAPPGDWDSPIPVYFLAVPAGQIFSFAVSPRRSDVPQVQVTLAHEWLAGALLHEGAGAKTATGYGYFRLEDDTGTGSPVKAVGTTWDSARSSRARIEFPSTLELVSPAFLAGASHDRAEDCDLRPASLRGLLRWWWRTMHAGYVDVGTLCRMEAAIWGDTKQGGAVRIELRPLGDRHAQLYDRASKLDMTPDQKRSEYGIPDCEPRKTTQGLAYLSFGMDRTGGRPSRYYLDAGCSWSLRLVARKPVSGLSADEALDQAKAALWLLCTFGGVGSKARKGFGSLSADNLNEWGRDTCLEVAARCRRAFHLPTGTAQQVAASSTLGQLLGPVTAEFGWPDVWYVLDQIGFAYQAFAKKYRHRLEKKALGLPHRIGPGIEPGSRFDATGPVRTLLDEARRQRKEENVRHASPVHIHVGRATGKFVVRVIAFPAAYLPDLATSTAFLGTFLAELNADLQRRAQLPFPGQSGPARAQRGRPGQGSREGPSPASPRGSTGSSTNRPSTAGPALPRVGDRVEAVLLEEKTRKGGWRARHAATGIVGPIQNTAAVPADKKPGDTLTLIVKSVNAREIAFAWPG